MYMNGGVSTWREAILSPSALLKDAIRNLNESALQVALIASEDGVLVGTLTDGDIRRGLLQGLSIDGSIEGLINHDPLVVPPQLSSDAVLNLMCANRIHQLPIVDENRHILGLHLMDELISPVQRSNVMVIMAGGQGMRLRPHTETCPKPLLKVGEKPMLEHIIENARSEGFGIFILSIQYLGHMIQEYFGDGSQFGVRIEYIKESDPLGTAGALGMLKEKLSIPFIVSNGDVLTDIRYGELLNFHERHQAKATMAVRVHEWQNPYGIVQTKGVDIVGFEEKPISRSHINAGVYALDPQALDFLGTNERCDMPTLFERLRERDLRTIVYPMHEPWLDVGRDEDLRLARSNHKTEDAQ
ncbi:CBS domain-containing protein [Polynucleobacter paneuropaeus]|nr:CBS domain-containing protein [Polynucleobacter paneuropaeus]